MKMLQAERTRQDFLRWKYGSIQHIQQQNTLYIIRNPYQTQANESINNTIVMLEPEMGK